MSQEQIALKMKNLLISLVISICATSAFAQTPVKLEGQVVCCADCWAKADRTKVEFGTAEDLLKAQSCVANGDPTLIAVREKDKFMLYQLEPAKFRLPGKNWLEFIGKRVALTGSVQKKKDTNVFRVDSLEVLAPSRAEQEASNVVSRQVDLTLKDPFGTPQSLSSLKGRIVVLNFWATYCIPCRKEMPDLATIQNEYAALGLQVVGASTDEEEDRTAVLRFAKETKVNFPIWLGATVADMMRFGLGGALPGTVVIGRDGRIVKVISGVVNPSELRKLIASMLASDEKGAAAEQRREKQEVESVRTTEDVSSVPS